MIFLGIDIDYCLCWIKNVFRVYQTKYQSVSYFYRATRVLNDFVLLITL